MPRLTEVLLQILKAEHEAEVLRRRHGAAADARLRNLRSGSDVQSRTYARLLETALRQKQPTVGRRRTLSKPAAIGAAGLVLALVGLGAASAAVGPAVSRGADVCLPLLSGENIADLAPRYGLEQQGSAWAIPASQSSVEIAPPGRANPRACALYVSHTAAEAQSVFDAVDRWASSSGRALTRVRDREPTADGSRLTSAWTGHDGGLELAVFLSKETAQTEVAAMEATVVITAQ